MKSFFPDVNVWLALSYLGHQRHLVAATWFDGLQSEIAYFSRVTQLSFLRLVTHPGVMGEDMKSQSEAWRTYNGFLSDERVSFCLEPNAEQLEFTFRKLTAGHHASSKQWPDAYLSAFAQTADLILVTFDRALHSMTGNYSLTGGHSTSGGR